MLFKNKEVARLDINIQYYGNKDENRDINEEINCKMEDLMIPVNNLVVYELP